MPFEASEAIAEAPAPAPAPEAPAPAAPEAPQSPGEKTQAAENAWTDDLRKTFRESNRHRDDGGRFAPKDGKPAEPAPALTEPKLAEGQTETPSAEVKPQPKVPAIDAPRSWSRDMQAKFAELPPEVQKYVQHREGEAHQHITRMGEALKAYEPIGQLLNEHREMFARNQVGVTDGVKALLNAQAHLERDAVGGIRWLMQTYGVDPLQLLDDGQVVQQRGPDPRVAELERQLAEQNQRLAQYDQMRAEVQRQQVAQVEQSYVDAVSRFASDKPDFNEIATDVYANVTALRTLIDSGERAPMSAEDMLSEAYDRAMRTNPKTFQKLVDSEHKKKIEAERKAAEEARKAGSLNVRGAAKANETGDLDSLLRATFRKANSR